MLCDPCHPLPGLKPVTMASCLFLALFLKVNRFSLFTAAPHFFFHRKNKTLITALQVQTPPSLSPFPAQPVTADLPAVTSVTVAMDQALPASHTSFCLIPVTTPRKPSPFQRDKTGHSALRTFISLLYFFST